MNSNYYFFIFIFLVTAAPGTVVSTASFLWISSFHVMISSRVGHLDTAMCNVPQGTTNGTPQDDQPKKVREHF